MIISYIQLNINTSIINYINMRIIDWLLKKSTHHKSLLIDHKDHKKKTRDSFRKVKRDNMLIVQKLKQHEEKIAKIEERMEENSQPAMKVYRKSR